MLLKNLVERSLVCDVDLVELWSLAGNELNAIDDFWGRIVEVVDDDDLVVCFEQSERRERANVAGTTAPLSIAVLGMLCDRNFSSTSWWWDGGVAYPVTRTDPTTILRLSVGYRLDWRV